MSKRPSLYVVGPHPVRANVVPLPAAATRRVPRETSWRDLVRRLATPAAKA